MIGIIGHVFLFCVAIIGILLALLWMFCLFVEYPIITNLAAVVIMLAFGVPIFYIPVIYFMVIAFIFMIIVLIYWISSMGESKNTAKEPESSSKEEVKIDGGNDTIIEITASNNSIVIEDRNNIFYDNKEIQCSSHPETVLSSLSLPFNQYQGIINREVFKEHNLPRIYDTDSYEDEPCLKQEYISTFTVAKSIKSSRLVALGIKPDFVCLNPNQEQAFTVYGIDQFGAEIFPGEVTWKATGGKINSQGQLIVNDDAKGTFRVTATAISTSAKVFQYSSFRNLLLIKISFKIFSWTLYHKRFIKDVASYFIEEFSNSELLVNEIFPDVDTNNINGVLTILAFDEIKEWAITTAIEIIIDYLDKLIVLCFGEKSSSLSSSVNYGVLPELRNLIISPSNINTKPGESSIFKLIGIDQKGEKLKIERKVSWEATGGSIDSKGKLAVHLNSQGSFKVTATVANLSTSINYSILLESNSVSISSSNSNIYSSNEKIKIHECRKIRYRHM